MILSIASIPHRAHRFSVAVGDVFNYHHLDNMVGAVSV